MSTAEHQPVSFSVGDRACEVYTEADIPTLVDSALTGEGEPPPQKSCMRNLSQVPVAKTQ